jgi:glutathione S-transferase
MAIVVHHLEQSRSQRIIWLLEELGESYEVKRYLRDPATSFAPPDLKAIHPLGKLPIVQDGSTTLAESGAIFDYFLARSGQHLTKPGEAEAVLRYSYFMHYADGSIMPQVATLVVLGRMGDAVQNGIATVREGLAAHLAWADSELRSRSWFAGDTFTAADIMMSFPIEAARLRGGLDWKFEHLDAWLGRVRDRPAYQRALARAEPSALPTSGIAERPQRSVAASISRPAPASP